MIYPLSLSSSNQRLAHRASRSMTESWTTLCPAKLSSSFWRILGQKGYTFSLVTGFSALGLKGGCPAAFRFVPHTTHLTEMVEVPP